MAEGVLGFLASPTHVLTKPGPALVELARRRDRRTLDVAALLGSLAAVILLQMAGTIAGVPPAWSALLRGALIMAQPYLLLRLVEHFRAVPTEQHVAAVALLFASWAILVFGSQPAPLWETLAIVVAFVYVEGYATYALARAGKGSRGVARKRLIAVALGSAQLLTVFAFAGVIAVLPAFGPVLTGVSKLLGLGSVVGFYLGFAPPRWLRRAWLMTELHDYLAATAGRDPDERLTAALDRVGPAAVRAVGGKAALLALGRAADGALAIHPDPELLPTLEYARVNQLTVSPEAPVVWQAWTERRPVSATDPADWGAELRQLARAREGAGGVLVAPLAAGDERHGLIAVLLDRGSLFMEDEATLLGLLAEQAAQAIEATQLVERLRDQNETLEAASRLKSEFLANMSHELRTPLNAIIGFSELLIDGPASMDEGDRLYLETIHKSGQHLLALINDVLDLAKVEAGKMELRPETLRLDLVVRSALSTVEPLAGRKNIQLAADLPEVELTADAGKVKQILYNLLSNAIKFTPEGGRVSVEAAYQPDGLRLTVADTGIGIAPEDQERVFQEFQQVDGAASRKYEGTGLGLALVRKFAELHGGRAWLESEVGVGSRFHVLFPAALAVAPSTAAAAPAVMAPAPDGPLVLVVEDDPSSANLVAIYLARGGYRTELAADGRQALAKARELRPAAITLDVLLPELDGWEVLQALKSDERTRDIPVVVASVVDDQPLGDALGAVDYLVKPVDRRRLLDAIGRHRPRAVEPIDVLAVDDDPAALDLLDGMLAPAGCRVRRAGGGREAIDGALADPPDLILLDLMMPEVTGFDVVDALREQPATRDVPVIVVTAKEITEADKAHLNGRVAAIVQKGTLSRPQLVEWLKRVLPGAAALPEAALV